jgi:hypothetical protein
MRDPDVNLGVDGIFGVAGVFEVPGSVRERPRDSWGSLEAVFNEEKP